MIIPLYLKDTDLSKTYKCFRVPARVTMVVLFTLTMAKLLTAKAGCECYRPFVIDVAWNKLASCIHLEYAP